VFLDESGVTTEMTRGYGRALPGERVRKGTPTGHWHTLTLLVSRNSFCKTRVCQLHRGDLRRRISHILRRFFHWNAQEAEQSETLTIHMH